MRYLSLSILDLAQNSIRSGASLVEITVESIESDALLNISVKDNGCGMSELELEKVTNPFYTTCDTHKGGLGIPLFVQRALLTGGSYKVSSEKGMGTKVYASFKTDSVNCVPIGNMADALTCLVISAPDVGFVYTYSDSKQVFKLDTKAFFSSLNANNEATTIKAALIKEYLAHEIIQ